MAECLIMRRGGEFYELPVLNTNYPKDVTLVAAADGSATFKVTIATAGKPAEYTYQWYVNGSKVSGATGSTYKKSGLTSAASYTVYCIVTNKAGTVQSRVAKLTVESYVPSTSTISYSGTSSIVDEGDYKWYMVLKTGNLATFKTTRDMNVDIFLVGGGGGGANGSGETKGGGGGGGYTTTLKNQTLTAGTTYTVTIGGGGSGGGGTGGTTIFSGISGASANGGSGGALAGGAGGSGGGGTGFANTNNNDESDDEPFGKAGNGGTNGGNGTAGNWGGGGKGQREIGGTNTYAFGESTWNGPIGTNPYSGGGGGGLGYGDTRTHGYYGTGGNYGGGNARSSTSTDWPGKPNSGGGGAAGRNIGSKGKGGSGVIIIRSAR